MPNSSNLSYVDTTKRHFRCASCSLATLTPYNRIGDSDVPCNDRDGHTWVDIPAHPSRHGTDAVYSDLSTLCNSLGSDGIVASQLLERLLRDHRTLQQTILGVFKSVIEGYARTAGSDLRNQDALDWAKSVLALTQSPSRTLPGRFPLI